MTAYPFKTNKVCLHLKLQADILVSSQEACSQAIINAGGLQMKKELVTPNVGDVTVTAGHDLPCKHVIHTYCSMWLGGEGGEVNENWLTYLFWFARHNFSRYNDKRICKPMQLVNNSYLETNYSFESCQTRRSSLLLTSILFNFLRKSVCKLFLGFIFRLLAGTYCRFYTKHFKPTLSYYHGTTSTFSIERADTLVNQFNASRLHIIIIYYFFI